MSTTTEKKKQSTRDERYEEARELLESGLDDIRRDSEKMRAYLAFRAHFHEYSFRNAMLIRQQLPGPRFCKGYRAWQKVGRQVQKGESGLLIFVPYIREVKTEEEAEDTGKEVGEEALFGFGTSFVFDISQTKPMEDYDGEVLTYTSPIPELEGDDFAALYEDLRGVAGRVGYGVHEFAGPAHRANGYCDPKGTIGIRGSAERSVNGKAKTLAHEIVHAQAHMLGGVRKDRKQSAHTHELQAEGAAFLLCYMLGFDTSKYSFPYMKTWAGENGALQTELAAIEGLAFHTLDLLDEVRS